MMAPTFRDVTLSGFWEIRSHSSCHSCPTNKIEKKEKENVSGYQHYCIAWGKKKRKNKALREVLGMRIKSYLIVRLALF